MTQVLSKILNFILKKQVYGVILTVIFALLIYKITIKILDQAINHGKTDYEKKKRNTINNLFKNIAKYFIIIISILTILSIYDINVGGMIAGLGITATIIGLALQDTLKDIISGINIISENYFIVGDIVSYNGFIGEVVEFGLKTTKLESFEGEVLTIANRNIMEITNLSKEEQTVYYNVCIPYEQPVSNIEQIIQDNIIPNFKKIPNVKEETVKYEGVNDLSESCVKYLICFQCQRDKQWQAKRAANKIIIEEFNKFGISVPYPQLEVHYEK